MENQTVSVRVHAAVADGKVTRNAVVTYPLHPDSSHPPLIRPFDREIHSTSDLNAVILLAPVGYTLPTSLLAPADFSIPGSFDAYLDRLAAEAPRLVSGTPVSVIVIEF